MLAQSLSHVWFSETLWTVAVRILCPWDSPGRNTGVGSHFLFQGIFSSQGSNPCLLHCQVASLPLVPPGKLIHPLLFQPYSSSRTSFLREALLVIHPAPLASTWNSLALRVRLASSHLFCPLLCFPLSLLPLCEQKLCFSFHLCFSQQPFLSQGAA